MNMLQNEMIDDLSRKLETVTAERDWFLFSGHQVQKAFDQLNAFIESHEKYDLSFGLQYSSIIDWVADITPRRNHPKAREYPLWQASATSPEAAILGAIKLATSAIADHEDETHQLD